MSRLVELAVIRDPKVHDELLRVSRSQVGGIETTDVVAGLLEHEGIQPSLIGSRLEYFLMFVEGPDEGCRGLVEDITGKHYSRVKPGELDLNVDNLYFIWGKRVFGPDRHPTPTKSFDPDTGRRPNGTANHMPRQRTDTFNHSLDQALQTLGTSMRAYEESLGVPFYQEDARFEHDGTALEVKFCLRASAEDNRAKDLPYLVVVPEYLEGPISEKLQSLKYDVETLNPKVDDLAA